MLQRVLGLSAAEANAIVRHGEEDVARDVLFRDVVGVKVPFKRVVSQTFMQMTVELSDVQPNAAVAAATFARPQPVARRLGADGP